MERKLEERESVGGEGECRGIWKGDVESVCECVWTQTKLKRIGAQSVRVIE